MEKKENNTATKRKRGRKIEKELLSLLNNGHGFG
jgi:hypothetical protein